MADSTITKFPTDLAPALATRRGWLIPGAALAVISGWMLVVCLTLQPALPILGMVLIGGCYIAMLASAAVIDEAATRNRTLAWLMSAMASAAVAVLLAVLLLEAPRLGA